MTSRCKELLDSDCDSPVASSVVTDDFYCWLSDDIKHDQQQVEPQQPPLAIDVPKTLLVDQESSIIDPLFILIHCRAPEF